MEKLNNKISIVIESVYLLYYDTDNRKIRCVWINARTWAKVHRLYTGEDEYCWVNGTLLIFHDKRILTKGIIRNLDEFTSFNNKIICAHHKPAYEGEPFVVKKLPCSCWEILTNGTLTKEKCNTFIKEGNYAIIQKLHDNKY